MVYSRSSFVIAFGRANRRLQKRHVTCKTIASNPLIRARNAGGFFDCQVIFANDMNGFVENETHCKKPFGTSLSKVHWHLADPACLADQANAILMRY
jgi:hypothetical protein